MYQINTTLSRKLLFPQTIAQPQMWYETTQKTEKNNNAYGNKAFKYTRVFRGLIY